MTFRLFVVCDICFRQMELNPDYAELAFEKHGWMTREDAFEHVCPLHTSDVKTRLAQTALLDGTA